MNTPRRIASWFDPNYEPTTEEPEPVYFGSCDACGDPIMQEGQMLCGPCGRYTVSLAKADTLPAPPELMIKECRCCDATYARSAWDALPLLGIQDDTVELLEYRNCRCGSTLAIVLGDSPSADTLPAAS
jgi:hypothetical protein